VQEGRAVRHVLLGALLLWPALANAADLSKVDRTIKKEPAYKGKPKYCLLVFGPEAKAKVWLVLDGDALYVDRNGNGDLTEPGKAVPSKKTESGAASFDVGALRVGPLSHTGATVTVLPLARWLPSLGEAPEAEAKALLARDSQAKLYHLSMSVEQAGRGGASAGRRIRQRTSLDDRSGLLQFADRPREAPVVHFGGPWSLTFVGKPALTRGRESDLPLAFGTPGLGAGTFAFVDYGGVVPARVFPVADITFPAAKPGQKPLQARYVLKERCWYIRLHGPVRVAKEAGKGNAKVTLSFDAWREVKVAPATFEVPVVDEGPKAKK
jgi:hypothetical protein